MKKTMISLMVTGTVIIFSQASAQNHTTWMKKTTFGIRAGVDFQNINGKDYNGNKMNNNIIPGFNTGVNLEIPMTKGFYLQPGLLLKTRGAEYSDHKTVHLAYLEIPVNFVYKPALGTGHLIAGFGPYIDFGIGGKVVYDGNEPDKKVHFTNNVTDADNDDYVYYRKVGAGANLLFGYEFANKLSFQLNTQLGLTDINPKYNNEPLSPNAVAKHTGFGISAGYRF